MKIYTTKEQVEKDIDSALNKVTKAKALAQEHLDAESLLEGTGDLTSLRIHRDAADKQFRKIKRLETVRLRFLKEKLAEMLTGSLALNTEMNCIQPENSPEHASQPQAQQDDSSCDVQP